MSREFMRLQILSWSEFIKISKFSKMIGLNNSSVSNFLKYDTKNLSDKNVYLLYTTIRDHLRKYFA